MEGVKKSTDLDRRGFLKLLAAMGAWFSMPSMVLASLDDAPLTKEIPSTGEKIPVIGMGTWITFNVGNNLRARNDRTEVLDTFFKLGGGMVDSSPMYGSAEKVMGYALNRLGQPQPKLFSATKVWTPFTGRGKQQIQDSFRLWGIKQFDLFQVHNLVNWENHLEHLLELKRSGSIRYVGITTSHGRRHGELEDIIRTQPIDFVQLTYNILDREVENRLLPAAKEKGVAVIANRPFQGGYLFSDYANQPLPRWAREIDCHNWAQFFLKFVVSHEAVTCAIPATSQVPHMIENMGAGRGHLPDAAMRAKMIDYIASLS